MKLFIVVNIFVDILTVKLCSNKMSVNKNLMNLMSYSIDMGGSPG